MTALHADRGVLVSGETSDTGLAVARRVVGESVRVWILNMRTETFAAALTELYVEGRRDHVPPYPDDPTARDAILRDIPFGRNAEPSATAALASLLAISEAACMNGSLVTIDGGRLA